MKKIGLVLAGGGGKGGYQIGVWQALREFGVDQKIEAISGTSVGALNSVLFLQGDFEKGQDVWLNISNEKILKVDPAKLPASLLRRLAINRVPNAIEWFSNHGWFSRDGLLEIIRQDVNLLSVSESKIPCFATCLNAETNKAEYFQLNQCSTQKIESILLASSAIPMFFDSVEIDGEHYYDGGLDLFGLEGDNIPIKPVYDQGCDLIIAVHLSRDSLIDHKSFPNAQIIEIIPQEHQGNLINGTLDFSPTGARRRISQGYQDTKKILQPIFDMAVVQSKMQTKLNNMRNDEIEFRQHRNSLLDERNQLKQELNKYLK